MSVCLEDEEEEEEGGESLVQVSVIAYVMG